MIVELSQNPAVFFLVAAAVVYIALMRLIGRLEYKYMLSKEPFTDEFCLERLAVMRGTGEYGIFEEAALKWHVPGSKKEIDFKIYLKHGDIPHYVRHFVREYKKEIEKSCETKFNSDDSLPPSWSA